MCVCVYIRKIAFRKRKNESELNRLHKKHTHLHLQELYIKLLNDNYYYYYSF